MKKQFFLIVLTLIIGINLNTQAHGFSVVNNGVTIYYNITSSTYPQTVEVTFRGNNPSSDNEYSGHVSIPDSVYYSGNYYKVTSIGEMAFINSGLSSVTIPKSITSIGTSAFASCGLASITIPSSVTSIGSYAFHSCTSLNTFFFNAYNCTGMGTYNLNVFVDCNNLNTIVIGDSVSNIPNYAFMGCTALTSIKSNAINPPSIKPYSFLGVSGNIPLYIPCYSLFSYQSDSLWNQFNNKVTVKTSLNISTSICQGNFYTNYGANIDSAGVYTIVNGCDSVILNLSITPSFETNYYDTVCKGLQYCNYGFSFIADTSGQYRRSLQSVNGCDSIIVLNLVVNPTPVIPTDLSVQVIANYIEFTWQSNGSSYAIYRNDSLIANVTQPIYLDYNVVNGQPYCYKVKAIKGDCESEFSNIVCKSFLGLSDISSNTIQTKIYPNPTNNKSKLEFEGLKSDAEVLVYDMIGRVIQKHTINKGNNELEIDLSGYAKGVYSIRIINDNINQTKKLIVQ